jgi:predicted nucleotidyltransferase
MSASDTRRGTFEVHRDDQSVNLPTALSPERVAEINEVIGRITRWARGREDIVGLLLVGSCARNAARPDSDIDIVLLTTDESRYLLGDAWAGEPGLGELIRTELRGMVRKKAAVVDAWIAAGRMAPVDSTHLFFTMWAATQTYADFDVQVRGVLGRAKLSARDHERATEHVVALVLRGCGLS